MVCLARQTTQIRQREISYDIAYMGTLKRNDTSGLICRNRHRLTDLEKELMVARGKDEGRDSWDGHVHNCCITNG